MTSNPRTQTKDFVEFYLQLNYCLRTCEPVIVHLLPAMERLCFCIPEVLSSNLVIRWLAILNYV